VGQLADKAARRLHNKGFGRITCLAGTDAGLSGFKEIYLEEIYAGD